MNSNSLIPSSPTPTHLAVRVPSPNDIVVPIFTLLAGLTKHSQLSSLIFLRSNTSITAPVSFFSPIILAGSTLVSFSTNTSPSFK